MHLSREDLAKAVGAGILSPQQAELLWRFLDGLPAARHSKFDSAHVLWYSGALVVFAAMSVLAALLIDRYGFLALAWAAGTYAMLFWVAGHMLYRTERMKTAGGVLLALASAMAPLVVYGVMAANGADDSPLNRLMLPIALGLMAGLLAFLYRAPILALPLGVALWAFLGTGAELLRPADPPFITTSIASGLLLALLGWRRDLKGSPRTGFWLHLVGAIVLWGGLTVWAAQGDGGAKALYCGAMALLLVWAVFLQRRTYAGLAALGLAYYLGYLAFQAFEDSLMFPVALSVIGLAIIAVGIVWRAREDRIHAWVDARLPRFLVKLRPDRDDA